MRPIGLIIDEDSLGSIVEKAKISPEQSLGDFIVFGDHFCQSIMTLLTEAHAGLVRYSMFVSMDSNIYSIHMHHHECTHTFMLTYL